MNLVCQLPFFIFSRATWLAYICHLERIYQLGLNWKMASTDFKKHEESEVHRIAASQYVEAKRMQETGDSVSQQLSCAYSSEVQLNRLNVRHVFELIWMARNRP